jgi:hypothetical protein
MGVFGSLQRCAARAFLAMSARLRPDSVAEPKFLKPGKALSGSHYRTGILIK